MDDGCRSCTQLRCCPFKGSLQRFTSLPQGLLHLHWFCYFKHSQAEESDSTLAAELENVKQQNIELQEENKLLHSKGIDLQLQIDDLLEELSRKEAEWCSKEEKLMLEVSYTPADGPPYKKGRACLPEILTRTPKRYQDPVLWVWFELTSNNILLYPPPSPKTVCLL